MLFGVGSFPLGIGATVVTLLVLAATNLSEKWLLQKSLAELCIRYRAPRNAGRARFTAAMAAHAIESTVVAEKGTVEGYELSANISWKPEGSEQALLSDLQNDPEVTSFHLVRR